MSAAALKWFGRQEIDDASLSKLLRALARASDGSGRVAIGQLQLAAEAGLKERATRSGLALLSRFGVVSVSARGSRKGGRMTNCIAISMHVDFALTKGEIGDARRAGCPNQVTGISVPVAPGEVSGATMPVNGAAPSSSEVPSLYIARAHALNFDAATVETLQDASARVWQEGDEWRARLTYQGLMLDLGRHECRDLAEAECRVRILDIAHALRTKTGTPREPVTRPDLEGLNGEALMDFLVPGIRLRSAPQGKSEAKGTSTTASGLTASSASSVDGCGADGGGVRGPKSPVGGVGAEAPTLRKQRQLPRARAGAREGGAA